MKKQVLKKVLFFTLCTLLIAAMAVCVCGCKNNGNVQTQQGKFAGGVMGEGKTVFDFEVVTQDGNKTEFEIHTDEKVVGDALEALGLIEGDEGDFGLYVKKVNGILADYDIDGTYWAFYTDGKYAVTGVDKTDIVSGSTYAFKVEK